MSVPLISKANLGDTVPMSYGAFFQSEGDAGLGGVYVQKGSLGFQALRIGADAVESVYTAVPQIQRSSETTENGGTYIIGHHQGFYSADCFIANFMTGTAPETQRTGAFRLNADLSVTYLNDIDYHPGGYRWWHLLDFRLFRDSDHLTCYRRTSSTDTTYDVLHAALGPSGISEWVTVGTAPVPTYKYSTGARHHQVAAGVNIWSYFNDTLLFYQDDPAPRPVSLPASVGSYVVDGDGNGKVLVLDYDTGSFIECSIDPIAATAQQLNIWDPAVEQSGWIDQDTVAWYVGDTATIVSTAWSADYSTVRQVVAVGFDGTGDATEIPYADIASGARTVYYGPAEVAGPGGWINNDWSSSNYHLIGWEPVRPQIVLGPPTARRAFIG